MTIEHDAVYDDPHRFLLDLEMATMHMLFLQYPDNTFDPVICCGQCGVINSWLGP